MDTSTGLATSWDPLLETSYYDGVYSLAVSGNTVFAGGNFRKAGGQWRSNLAALDATMGLVTGWNPYPQGSGYPDTPRVLSLAVLGPRIYVGGVFYSICAQIRSHFAQLDTSWISVLSPGGGEYWAPGSPHAVSWTSCVATSGVRLFLYDNWTKLRTLATVPITDGSWTWTIPPNEVPSSTYRIRAQSLTDATARDYSDKPFGIGGPRSLTLTVPNSGESWSRGTQHAMMWTSANLTGTARVYLYSNWTKVRVIARVPIAGGGYMWNIPASEPVGATYRIRVQSLTYPTIQDYSDSFFTISPLDNGKEHQRRKRARQSLHFGVRP